MKDEAKTKQQLIRELVELRHRISDFEQSKVELNDIKGIQYDVRDITDRKLTEKILRDSEEKYRSLASTADSMYLVDRNCRYLFMNEKYSERLGLPRDEVINRTYGEFHSEEDTRIFAERIEEIFKTVTSVQYEHKSKRDGRYFLRTLSPVKDREKNRTMAVTVVSKDITDRKQAEEAVLRTKEDWEKTFHVVPDLIAIIDTEYRIVRVNRAMASRLGVTPNECVGLTCYSAVHGTTEPPEFCPHSQLLKDGLEHTVEVHEDRLGGDFIVSVSPLRDPEGKVIGSVHVVRDITKRKQAEEAVRESENKFRVLTEKAVVGVYLIQDERFIYINPRLADILGYTVDELAVKVVKLKDIVAQEDWPMAREYLRKRLSGEVDSIHYEFRMVKKSGEVIFVEAYGSRIIYNGRPAIIGTLLDISERKRAEEEQRHREKLQGILEMAGAICHEMNQPMQIISGFSELLMKDLSENDPIHKKLSIITMQIDRMGVITQKLMKIKDYETQDYAGFSRIIDINKSSNEGTE